MVMAGQLDRDVTFQSVVESSNDYNEEVPTYSDAFTTFAKVTELQGKEDYEGHQKQNRADIRLKIRFREDVTLQHRFVYKDQTYDITSIQELGRRDALAIFGNIRVIP